MRRWIQLLRFLARRGTPGKAGLLGDWLKLEWLALAGGRGAGHMRLAGWRISFGDFELLRGLFHEIFIQRHYALPLATTAPRIIDAGANIGLSALFFVGLYPGARITCFEPDPRNHELLMENVRQNNLESSIAVHQAALADHDGELSLFVQSNVTGGDVGASIVEDLRYQYHDRADIRELRVPCRRLSPLLAEPVDVLKMDIEGGEAVVIPEIAGSFGNVRHVLMEFHCMPGKANPLSRLLQLFEEHGHAYEFAPMSASPIETGDPHPAILVRSRKQERP